jgi:adenylate cyclase
VAEQQIQRRLAAILAADVAGYSRLMGADEEGTLARLKAHRRHLVDPKIAEHHGRIVKTTGDGLLVEFPSVVNAVRCAVEVQRAMSDRDGDIAEDQRIRLRTGVNLGDIIIDDQDIFGDGVNVAARLEALAEPGGICIARTVRDQPTTSSFTPSRTWGSSVLETSPGRYTPLRWAPMSWLQRHS